MNNPDIKQLITKILDQLQLEYSNVHINHDNEINTTFFNIESSSHRDIVGRDGDTLHSINYIVRRIVEKNSENTNNNIPNFTVDCGNFHSKRINDLKIKARIIADRARSFKRTVELEPMSGYDRLIIHSFIANLPNMRTESTGMGRNRRVTIKYEGESGLIL